MSRFNQTKTPPTHDTVNRAGGKAFSLRPKLAFASMVVTFMAQDQYYRSAQEGLEDLRDLIGKVDPKFAAKAGIYARHYHGLRSVSHVIAAELAPYASGEEWAKHFYASVVSRPDDITEILAYYAANVETQGNGIAGATHAMKKGLGAALTKFDAYELDKYARRRHEVSLHDAVNVLHPPHTEAIADLVEGEIEQADTWEKQKTAAGEDSDKDQSEVWANLLKEGKLGYMATLRNLRNIAQEAGDTVLTDALEVVTDEGRIRASKMLPFRYTTALEAIQEAAIPQRQKQKIMQALEDAAQISLENVPEFEGRSLIAVDVSGSMRGDPIEKASLFGATMYTAWPDSDILTFAGQPEEFNPFKSAPVLSIASRLRDMGGGGTDMAAPFDYIAERKLHYDRIFVLSDMQAWKGQTSWGITGSASAQDGYEHYTSVLGHRPHLYTFDFEGYGDMQFPEKKVYCLAGFSPRVFDVMDLLETDTEAFVDDIEDIDL